MANCPSKKSTPTTTSLMEHFELSTGGIVGVTIAAVLALIGLILFIKLVFIK